MQHAITKKSVDAQQRQFASPYTKMRPCVLFVNVVAPVGSICRSLRVPRAVVSRLKKSGKSGGDDVLEPSAC